MRTQLLVWFGVILCSFAHAEDSITDRKAAVNNVETQGSHAIYVSQPQAVIKLIEQGANGAG